MYRSELTTSPMGVRICVCILDDMVDLHDAEEASDGAKAFDVGCVTRDSWGSSLLILPQVRDYFAYD